MRAFFPEHGRSPVPALASEICALVDRFEAELSRGFINRETAEELHDLLRRASTTVVD